MKLSEAIILYKGSPKYTALSPNSKRAYGFAEKHLSQFMNRDLEELRRSDVVKFGDAAKHKGSARLAMVLLANATKHCFDRDLVAAKLDTRIDMPKQQSHLRWTQEEIDIFLAHAPKHVAMLALMVLYTGQRKSDVIKMKWSDYDGQCIKVVQKKTKRSICIPVHRQLQLLLTQRFGFIGVGTILHNAYGSVWTEESAGRAFSRTRRECLSRPLTLHGLRHTTASILAELGLSPSELASILGHTTLREVARYTSGVDQKALAEKAIRRWEENE